MGTKEISMRLIAATALFALTLAVAGIALAAAGQHGNLKMTTTVDMGANAPAGMEGMDEPQVMLGEVWLTENRMRMDIDTGMGQKMITIMDLTANEMYSLDPMTKTAWRHDLKAYQEMAGSMGGDFMNPSSMFNDWESYIAMLEGLEWVSYEELGEKTINSHLCKGLGYTVDTEAMMAEFEEADAPGGEMMGTMGDYSGEIWYSDNVQMMPVYMVSHMEMMGMKMDMNWELTDVDAWTPTDSTFAIPEGYKVEDMNMDAPFGAAEGSEGGEAAPAPAA
jgi:hypothetical protein